MKRKRAPLPQALKSLRKRLNHRDENTREQAFQEALALPPDLLLQLMKPEAKQARGLEKIQQMLGALGCVWVLVCLITAIGQFIYHTPFLLWDVLLFLWIPVIIGSGLLSVSRNRLRGMLIRAILAQTDPRFALSALLLYEHLEPGFYKDIRQTLLRLLPLLTLADVEAWTATHNATLRRQAFWHKRNLDFWHDLEMLECALQTLARVGSAEDVATVRSIARMTPEQIAGKIRPNVRAEDRKEVYRAILDSTILNPEQHGSIDPEHNAVMQDERYHYWCLNRARDIYALANCSLAALLERSEQQQQVAGLLRPSQATDDDAAHILLRPQIEAESQTPPEQLLRPHQQ